MRVYTVHKSSFIVAVGIVVLLTVTFWLNCRDSEFSYDTEVFTPPSSAEEGFSIDGGEVKDDDTLTEKELNSNVANDAQNDYDDYQRDEDEDNENPVFRKGDFDDPATNANISMQMTTTDEAGLTQHILQNISRFSNHIESYGLPVVENGIYWSNDIEKQMPKGLSSERVKQLQMYMRQTSVQELLPPSWNQCGRPKNQIAVLSDGSRACARYRVPHQYLVLGEVLSYYLARLLNITHVPVLILSKVDRTNAQWSYLSGGVTAFNAAGWQTNSTIALIRWVQDLERSQMPKLILSALKKGTAISSKNDLLDSMSTLNLIELMQWSDLIVFDYLTGNYDRVASMQDTAEKEAKPSVFNENVHNLVRNSNTGALWLIDNESGLLDAYSLLYSEEHPSQGERFLNFHKLMLQTICVFRRSTVRQIRLFGGHSQPHKFLLDYVKQNEPLFYENEIDYNKYELFRRHFKHRIEEVNIWINQCQRID
ncbi:Four-jointed box protein 1 [Chamberlinius hualienensis]